MGCASEIDSFADAIASATVTVDPEDDVEPILTQREQRVLRALKGYPKDRGFNAAGIPWLTELRDHSRDYGSGGGWSGTVCGASL